ncbi:MAG: queuosine precursor transporter [Clostridia bacterium]|nr:queuosine precursor transporter [Clostridia bacterium]
MSNEMIFMITVLFYLGCVPVLYRLFGKTGLFAFSVFGTLLGNIAVCKTIDLFGISTTAGNVLYASTFLVTDILSENHGKKEAAKAVRCSFAAMLLWIAGTQLILLFTPNGNDFISPSLNTVFGLVPRISLASIAGYLLSQNIDVFLYHFLWEKSGSGRAKLWLRNNGSTLISQAVDTAVFTTLAFYGTYPTEVFLSILLSTYFFKAIVALLDTPFAYLSRMIRPVEG